MKGRTVIELRGYLKKAKRDEIPEFDEFLANVEVFIKLRVKAEENFRGNPQLAKSKRHALPLDWLNIADILNPDTRSPEESLVTQIVRECLAEAEGIIQDFRNVLVRHREMVSLGMVQQVDAQCLRWFSKQPGRDAVEKAGSRQRILAVVRKENYNTLENRVFKDFVSRIQNPCAEYLKRNETEFKDHNNVKKVKRLFLLCGEALRNPIMDSIGDITEMPHPNYVLRQEQRYSKIWKGYCRIVRHAHMAELLWNRNLELDDTLCKLAKEVPFQTHTQARYHCPIWFNYIDGKNGLLDLPFYKNEISDAKSKPLKKTRLQSGDIIIDLTGNQPRYNLLIYGCHDNAKPYLQNYEKPSFEDMGSDSHFCLNDILRNKDHTRLRDYFEQLYAHLKGERWFILVPDEWKPLWQEAVIKSVPLSRQKVVLLWRSVAATLGVAEKLERPKKGDTVAVIDFQQGGVIGMSKLTLAKGENGGNLIPQRKSHARHKQLYSGATIPPYGQVTKQESFLSGRQQEYVIPDSVIRQINGFVMGSKHVLFVNGVGIKTLPDNGILLDEAALETGVQSFITKRDQGEVSYYDELEALSLIVQTGDERVIAKSLVEANEKSPGGKEVVMQTIKQVATLKKQSDYVDLILCMGEATPTAPLKIKRHKFNRSLSEDHAIDLSVRVTPGQGMAIVSVMSDFLRETIELDFLCGMTDKGDMVSLEEEMERSFPPDSPDVVADDQLWASIKGKVNAYINNAIPPDGTWFAKATLLYSNGHPLPKGSSPLEGLRRKNVFGNDPKRQLPKWGHQQTLFDPDFEQLFQKLANDYENTTDSKERDLLARLIAWTYQSKHASFKPIRKTVVKRVLDYATGKSIEAPLFQEMSLCANLCITKIEWRDCLNAVRYRIANHDNNVHRDFYLLYNLLQFHPTIIRDTNINNPESCWEWVQHFPHWYREYQQSSTTIGYILKSLLYFLRCRRFDGKQFLTKDRDSERYEIISDCLKGDVPGAQENLRKLVIKYLNNKGTIDGLPVN